MTIEGDKAEGGAHLFADGRPTDPGKWNQGRLDLRKTITLLFMSVSEVLKTDAKALVKAKKLSQSEVEALNVNGEETASSILNKSAKNVSIQFLATEGMRTYVRENKHHQGNIAIMASIRAQMKLTLRLKRRLMDNTQELSRWAELPCS